MKRMNFGTCFALFKSKYHHISTRELCAFHREYVEFIRSFKHSSNILNKTSGHGNILKRSLRNDKYTGKSDFICDKKLLTY